jgi:hypothetical protein
VLGWGRTVEAEPAEIPVIVEPTDAGYRARCRHPVAAEAVGGTRHEATQALEAARRAACVPDPFVQLPLEVTPDKPWIATAGPVPDDETTDAWLDAIAEYRRQCDAADQASIPQDANPTCP